MTRSALAALAIFSLALVLAWDHGESRGLRQDARAAGDPVAGAKVFADNGCAVCHTLTRAKASGTIGPNLDATKLDAAGAAAVIGAGRAVMPSFKGKLSATQIADVAAFVTGSEPAAPKPKPTPKPKPNPKPAPGRGSAPSSDSPGVTLPVRLTESGVIIGRRSIEPATVGLVVRNAGRKAHALVVARISPDVRLVASFAGIAPGASARRSVRLVAGRYTFTASGDGLAGPHVLAVLVVRKAKDAAPATPSPTPAPNAPVADPTAPPARSGDATNGARLFASLGCGGCHTFAPAGTTGTVGPNLGVTKPAAARIASILNLGSGAMPSFASRASQQDIADLAAYITSANASGAGGGSGAVTGAAGGAQLFAAMGCGGCHTLAAAGARGTVGPNLDSLRPSQNQVVAMVTAGGGVMPAFGGRLSTSQILEVAAYVSSVAGNGAAAGGGSTAGGGVTTGPIGLVLFQRGGCGACHTLAAARTTGTVGPDLDDKKPDRKKVVKVMIEGKDQMPSFTTVFSNAEMQELGAWIESVTDR